jgi:hypothetical protein
MVYITEVFLVPAAAAFMSAVSGVGLWTVRKVAQLDTALKVHIETHASIEKSLKNIEESQDEMRQEIRGLRDQLLARWM